MKLDWHKFRKYLSIASDILPKLPHLGDSPLTMFVKGLAIVDSFDKKLGKDSAMHKFFTDLSAVSHTNAQFVDLFFSTPLKDTFTVEKIPITDYTDIVVASDPELGSLYFIEYHWGGRPDPSPDFWHSKGFNFEKALKRVWTSLGNGIQINLKIERDRMKAHYRPIVFTQDPLLGAAVVTLNQTILRHIKLTKDGFSRTYLFVGKQGVGKSTFATRMAQACGARTLRIDAKGMTTGGASDLSFLLNGLNPDFLILDDIDRVSEAATAVPVLLEALSDLKERHPSVTAILTANDIAQFDPAVIRPGRIDSVLIFKEPVPAEREELLLGYLKEYRVRCNPTTVKALVKATDGLTAAYLREIVIQLKHAPSKEVLTTIKQMRELATKKKVEKASPTTPPSNEPPKKA